MKRTLILLSIVVSSHGLTAQQPEENEIPIRYFNEGKQMFLDKNYIGSEHSLYEFRRFSGDNKLNMEADYMIVSSLYFRGSEQAELLMKEFLDTYPETYHRNQLSFYIGSCHFDKKEWEKALFWFEQSDIDYLNIDDQQEYAFRAGYVNLQKGQREKAKVYFTQLNRYSAKYKTAATYYLAYMDFQEKNYEKALKTFEQLKNIQEYREESLVFLTQGNFIQGDLNRTIAEGKNYLQEYPGNKNTKEIYRILGNSYNRLGNTQNSIVNYEKYLQLEPNPIAEDMYLLGTTYYQMGDYRKAIEVLKYAASTNTQLGQAAYMQLGQSYLKVDDTENALLAFEAASRVNFDPSVSEGALYNYALLVHQTSFSVFDQPVTVFQRFLKEYPESRYAAQVNGILASTFLSTKNYQAAMDAIQEIKSPDRQILEARQIIYFRLGTQDFINNNYVSAARNFNACIQMGDYNRKVRNESRFWLGEMDYRQGNYPAATQNYQSYISGASATDENYSLALYNLGYTYFQMKQYSNSLLNFQKYTTQEKDKKSSIYADALNRIGDCYLYNRNFAEAEKYYGQAVSANPGNADYAEFQKAFVMGLRRNYTGKISALDEMMAKYPNSSYYDDALYEKSRALVMLGRETDAIRILEQLIKDYPQSTLNQQAGVQLGQLYFNTNSHQKSIEAYKRVITTYPNSEEARISIKSLESVYKEINDINSYASYVNSLGMGTVITTSRQDSLSFLAAENIYMRGQKVNSKEAMRNYLQSYPNGSYSGDAHYLLGYIALEEKDTDTALSEFTYVINSNNRKYMDDALIHVSGIQLDRKLYEDAYKTYEKLNNTTSSAENKNTAQLGMLRSAYLASNQQQVIEAANILLDNQKTSPEIMNEARYYRAKALLAQEKGDEAAKDLNVLAEDTRNSFGAEAQYILADIYYQAGSYSKATEQVQSFMKKGTPHEYWMAKALIILSDSYKVQGEDFQAKQYLESLNANYKGTETDIKEAIEKRLNN